MQVCHQAASPVLARLLAEDLRTGFDRALALTIACFEDDFDAGIARLAFPPVHYRANRTTD